jgi:hypothetical protein
MNEPGTHLQFRVSAVERGRTVVHAPFHDREAALRLARVIADTSGSHMYVLCTTDPWRVPERLVARVSPRVP